MLALAALLLVANADSDTIKGSTVPLSWATCDDGEPADLRPDAPLLVLSDSNDLESDWHAPYFTAFVLYRDGRAIARRDAGLAEWHLSPGGMQALLARVHWDELRGLASVYDVRTAGQRERDRGVFDHVVTQTYVQFWQDGCARSVRIRGLSTLLLSPLVRASRHEWHVVRQGIAEAHAMLAELPPLLKSAVEAMLAGPAGHGHPWCGHRHRDDLAECFSRDHLLPYHELWDGPEP